mmetsp:Transcript_21933/g.61305  ORF Transcript_21933/g.61305 Transcript_21933/m.61305 type:complete len:249 (-) Transcript_21933:356-1102(-)
MPRGFPKRAPRPSMITALTNPMTKRMPDFSPVPLNAAGSIAVAIMASIAPPVRPSKAVVVTVRTRARKEPFSISSGMMREPAIARTPVTINTLAHMAKFRWAGMFSLCSSAAPLKASGKLAMKTESKKENVIVPSFVMNPSMKDSGMPSSMRPSHMETATLPCACVPGPSPISGCRSDLNVNELRAAIRGSWGLTCRSACSALAASEISAFKCRVSRPGSNRISALPDRGVAATPFCTHLGIIRFRAQ